MNAKISTILAHGTVLTCAGYIGAIWYHSQRQSQRRETSTAALVTDVAGASFISSTVALLMYNDEAARTAVLGGVLGAVLVNCLVN